MDPIIRAFVVYAVMLAIFRIAGKRALANMTTFDLVLTLIISEAIQQALIDDDNSMTNAFLLVITLVGIDIAISLFKQRSPWFDRLVEGSPVVLLEPGTLHRARMDKERVDEADILDAARELTGLERIDQIRYAVLEKNGKITIVPQRGQVSGAQV